MPTTKCKIRFSKVLQIYAREISKSKPGTFIYVHLVETFALILNSKIVFMKLVWLKLSILKKIHYMHLTL